MDTHVRNHSASLGVCRAYANTFKHMKRDSPAQTVARIASIETGPNGPEPRAQANNTPGQGHSCTSDVLRRRR